MKQTLFTMFVAIIIVTANSVIAQNITDSLKSKSGIYMTFDDYKAKKLNLEIDSKVEKHKIKVNDFINKSEIVVKHKNKKYVYKKGEIYGILDNKGFDYRFFNNI